MQQNFLHPHNSVTTQPEIDRSLRAGIVKAQSLDVQLGGLNMQRSGHVVFGVSIKT